jgi:parallel beta-helix repeat protein
MKSCRKFFITVLLTFASVTFSFQAYAQQQLGIHFPHPQEAQFSSQLEKAFSNLVSVSNYKDKVYMLDMLTRYNMLDAVLISKDVYDRHNSAALIPLTEVQISGKNASGLVLATHSFLSKPQQTEILSGYQELLLSTNGLELLEFYATGKGNVPKELEDTPPKEMKTQQPSASLIVKTQAKAADPKPDDKAVEVKSAPQKQPVVKKTASAEAKVEPKQAMVTEDKKETSPIEIKPSTKEEPRFSKNIWRPHVDITGKLGNDKSLGELELFIPVAQQRDRLFFLDMRFQLDDNDETEGNFGLGFRKIIDNIWILGGYAFYDLRESFYDNDFQQITLGVEALTEEYDARINAYLADDKNYLIASQESVDQIVFSGFNLVHQSGGPAFEIREKSMSGFDAELGWRLPWFDKPEVRSYIGGYHFSASGVEDISGPRGRLEVRLPDVFGWSGSLFELGGEIRHDNVRDTDYFISARGRIPFGSVTKAVQKPRGLSARMTERIQRDPDIVVANQEKNTSAPLQTEVLTMGGEALTITHVDSHATSGDGSVETPFSSLASAETLDNGIVLLYADSTFDGEGITLKPNQRLLGESLEHLVNTDQLGLLPLPRITEGTQAPIIQNITGSAIELAEASEVSGVVVNNADIGIYGSGISGVNINRNNIANIGDGILLESLLPDSDANVISDNTIQDADYDGIYVYNDNATGTVTINIADNRIEDLGLATIYGAGIAFENEGNELLTNVTGNTIINSYDEGIYVSNLPGATTFTALVSGNQTETTGLEGMAFINDGDTMNLTVLDNQVQDVAAGFDGTAFVNAGNTLSLYLQGNRVSGDNSGGLVDYLLDNLAGTFNMGATTGYPAAVTDTDNGVVADEGNTRFDSNEAPLVEAVGDFSIVDKTTIPAP